MTYPNVYKKVIISLIVCLTLFLVLFHFTSTPKVWVDEGFYTEVAKNVALHSKMGIQLEPGHFYDTSTLTVGYPTIYPVAASLRFFGVGLWQARLPMIIYMFCLVLLFYLFTKKRYGFYFAILSVLLLLSFSPFYGNGRVVIEEIPGLVWFVLGILMLTYLEESNFQNRYYIILAGLALGICASSKPIYLALVSASLILVLSFWFKKIEKKNILIFGATGFLLPLIFWAFTQFPTIHSLLNIVPTYFHLASNHETKIPMIQTIFTNSKRLFTESTPTLFILLLGSSVAGLIMGFLKKERKVGLPEAFLLSFIILNIFAYLPGTGWYRYFFPASTLVYLLFPVSIFIIASVVKNETLKKFLLIIPILLIFFQFYHLTFLSDTSLISNPTRNKELSLALSEIKPSQKVFFYNSIEATVFLKSTNYSQYLSMGDYLEIGDKNGPLDPSFDYILAGGGFDEVNFPASLYEKKIVDRYVLYKKI